MLDNTILQPQLNEFLVNPNLVSQNNQKMHFLRLKISLFIFFWITTKDIKMKLMYMFEYKCNEHMKLSIGISPQHFFFSFDDKDFFYNGT